MTSIFFGILQTLSEYLQANISRIVLLFLLSVLHMLLNDGFSVIISGKIEVNIHRDQQIQK